MKLACYDLAYNPPTFDAVAFAVQVVEQFGSEDVQINIAEGPVGGFRDDNLWPRSTNERMSLFCRVLYPIFEMMPTVKNIMMARGGFGTGQYTIPWKHFVRCNGKRIRPLQPRNQFAMAKDPRLVTITLREADHWPERNSNVPEWLAAAREIRAMGFRVVFVRDTNKWIEPLEDFTIASRASAHLQSRAALYRAACCNMFVSNGPAWLSMACDAPTIVFRPTCEQLGACYDSNWFRECGIEPGGQFPGSADHHELVWSSDDRDQIVHSFRGFAK